MENQDDARLLRIFIGESDTYDGQPLYQAIVEVFRRQGLAGATVLRGIEGFGKSSILHAAHILRLSEDLPIVIECVDSSEKIENVLPTLDEIDRGRSGDPRTSRCPRLPGRRDVGPAAGIANAGFRCGE